MRAAWLAGAAVLAVAAFSRRPSPETRRPWSSSGRIDTPIHPASASYLKKLLAGAEADGAALVVADALDAGRAARLDARDELGDPRRRRSRSRRTSRPRAPRRPRPASSCCSRETSPRWPRARTPGPRIPVGGEGQDLPKTMNEKAEQDARAFVRTLARAARAATSRRRRRRSRRACPTRRPRRRRRGSSRSSPATSPTCVGAARRADARARRRQRDHARARRARASRGGTWAGWRSSSASFRTPTWPTSSFCSGLVGLYFELSTPGRDPARASSGASRCCWRSTRSRSFRSTSRASV